MNPSLYITVLRIAARSLRIDALVTGSKPSSAKLHLEQRDSLALCYSRRGNYEDWSDPEKGPGHCSISKKLLNVLRCTFECMVET